MYVTCKRYKKYVIFTSTFSYGDFVLSIEKQLP